MGSGLLLLGLVMMLLVAPAAHDSAAMAGEARVIFVVR